MRAEYTVDVFRLTPDTRRTMMPMVLRFEPRAAEHGCRPDRPHLLRNPDPRRPLRLICVDTPPSL
jgi:hypothetical protein